ncbi:MAG TPA: hypothetical protein VNA25_12635 [Phycisphaerae bacterium]|nr:hypothetical protein [Phycisphaerae bacterium]
MTLAHFVKDNPLWCHKCRKLTRHNDPILVERYDRFPDSPLCWRITATCVCEYRDKHGWIVAESLLE